MPPKPADTEKITQEKTPATPQLDAEGNPIIHPADGQKPAGSGVAPPGTAKDTIEPVDDQTKKTPGKEINKKAPPNVTATKSPSEIIDEILDGDDKKKKGTTKKRTQSARNPTVQSQLAELMTKLDRQAARTDELYSMVRPAPHSPLGHRRDQAITGRHHTAITTNRQSRPVLGSHYKRRSPKGGKRSHARSAREPSYSFHRHTPSESSNSSTSDIEAQVSQALDMMEPHFATHKGKSRRPDDSIKSYRPFAFLERERQREIIRHGHPEELTFVQHITGLCLMALEYTDDRCYTFWILQHVIQILEDHEFIQWPQTRAFSNTVISNIARGKWAWDDEKLIERCRSNNYMRRRAHDDSSWSVPCPRFNKGRCEDQDSHAVGQVMMRHVCAHCAMNGYENPHTLRACSRRKGAGQGSSQQKSYGEDKKEHRGSRSHSSYRYDANTDAPKN